MTCREKLITEHPEWSEVIVMKCTDIFTPNEYFTLDGPELLWFDIYPGVVEECSEDEYEIEKRELIKLIKDYDDRLTRANEEIKTLKGYIEEWKRMVDDLNKKLDDANKCDLDVMIKQLQFDNDTLQEELKDAHERIAEVTECYGESLKERDDLKKKLDKESNLVDIYGARLDTKDSMIKKLNETNEDLANKLAAERAKVETRTEEIDKLVKENEGLRESADILSDGIDRRENENTRLYNKVSELDRTIEEQQEKIKLRDEEIDKLVKENEGLRKQLDASNAAEYFNDHVDELRTIVKENPYIWYCKDELVKEIKERDDLIEASKIRNDTLETNWRVCSDENKKLRVTLADREKDVTILKKRDEVLYHDYNQLKCNIEIMGFTVTDDNKIVIDPHKPHFMSALEYAEHDLEMTKKVAEHYKSLMETSPIVLTKSEESTIRPFNELPYVRYARHIHMKYKALTDSGFSHDDAMGLIPMWDDNEFEGFKRMEE